MGHAVVESGVPLFLVFWGQLNPGLHVDGDTFGCGVIVDAFLKDSELAMWCDLLWWRSTNWLWWRSTNWLNVAEVE